MKRFCFIAQIIAALAIVGSLIFVGLQVRSQTRDQRISRTVERAKLAMELINAANTTPSLVDILIRLEDGETLGDLSRFDLMSFTFYMRTICGGFCYYKC